EGFQLKQVAKYIEGREYGKAEDLCTAIIEAYPDSMTVGQCHNNLGVVHMMLEEYDKATNRFKLALANYPKATLDSLAAYPLYNLGLLYKKLGAYTEASENLYGALRLLERKRSKIGLNRVLNTLANLHRENGDYDQAVEFIRRSSGIAQQL